MSRYNKGLERTFISTFLELLVRAGLLNKFKNLSRAEGVSFSSERNEMRTHRVRELSVCERPHFSSSFGHYLSW